MIHHEAYKIAGNTLLFIFLLLMLILPVSTMGIVHFSTDPQVLSAQSAQPKVQIPREKILRNNAEKLTREKQRILTMPEEEEEPESELSDQRY